MKGMLVAVALLGCADGKADESEPTVVVDDLGRSVAVPTQPHRVVSLAPGLTEIVFAAGGGDLLAAVTTADSYPAAVDSLPKIGAYPLNREAVVGQNPDLVLATDQVNSPHDVEPLSELGIPTFFLQFETVGEVINATRKVGDLLHTSTIAEAAADALQDRWDRVQTSSASVDPKPRVLLLVGADVLYAFGADSYANEIVLAAGGDPITGQLPGQSAVLNDEFVLANPPDIIVGPRASGEGPGFSREILLTHHPSWDVLPAIRSNRVFTLDPDLMFRAGPRVVDAAEQIAVLVRESVEGGAQ